MQTTDLILEQFASLPPKMQVAARFIVDHPNEVVIASMRTVAERAGAHPATLVRLAQQLGYSGWPLLKAAFAEDLGLHSERYGQRARNLVARKRDPDLLGEMFVAQRQNLDLTEALCASSLLAAVRLLKRAHSVHVAGFRASFPIACSLVYGYRLFRNSVQLINGQSGGLEMQLRLIEGKDAVVVISFSPYSREAVLVVEAAQAVGARVIALTDSNASPLALAADVAVLFSVNSPSFFPSVTAAVAVAESLLELLLVDAGKAGVERLGQAENRLYDSGAYLQKPAKRKPGKDRGQG